MSRIVTVEFNDYTTKKDKQGGWTNKQGEIVDILCVTYGKPYNIGRWARDYQEIIHALSLQVKECTKSNCWCHREN